jgi:hypothetical protein
MPRKIFVFNGQLEPKTMLLPTVGMRGNATTTWDAVMDTDIVDGTEYRQVAYVTPLPFANQDGVVRPMTPPRIAQPSPLHNFQIVAVDNILIWMVVVIWIVVCTIPSLVLKALL